MPVRVAHPDLGKLYEGLQACEPRGRALAAVLDRRGTTVRFAPIKGGFTLNLINTIFLQPLPANCSDADLKYWISLFGHEACHIEQGFIVDSVAQEVQAYTAQCQVAAELGISDNAFLQQLRQACENVDPSQIRELQAAREAINSLLGDQPATMLYKALPVLQPRGLAAIPAALVELWALAGTLFAKTA